MCSNPEGQLFILTRVFPVLCLQMMLRTCSCPQTMLETWVLEGAIPSNQHSLLDLVTINDELLWEGV